MQKTISFLLLLTLLFNSSCIARQVKKDSSYIETFYGYFASKYNNEIVFIGKKYHYVFKDEQGYISELTKSEWKNKVNISQIKLMVDKNNNVYGDINLDIMKYEEMFFYHNKISSQQEFFLKENGFVENDKNQFSKIISLKGIRYEPSIGFDNKIKNSFSKEYKTEIFYDGDKTKKAALTPIAYAADGFLILAGGVWIPLIIIAVTSDKKQQKTKY